MREVTDVGKKILVVDDEQAIADLIEVYLAGEGWEVIKCDNGTDAVRCVEEEELSMAKLKSLALYDGDPRCYAPGY